MIYVRTTMTHDEAYERANECLVITLASYITVFLVVPKRYPAAKLLAFVMDWISSHSWTGVVVESCTLFARDMTV